MTQKIIAVIVCAFCFAINALAETYYSVPLDKLQITDGKLPSPDDHMNWRPWQDSHNLKPQIVLNKGVEGYVCDYYRPYYQENARKPARVVVCSSAPEVSGTLYLPKSEGKGMVKVGFKIPASAVSDENSRKDYWQGKAEYYQDLIGRNVPGGAWFRYQANEAKKNLGQNVEDQNPQPNRFRQIRPNGLEDTYGLFSGGRAVSENLQLDRVFPPLTQEAEQTVEIKTISGISVREMDWTPLIKDAKPATDPLAAAIPADQHAIFFPTFEAMITMVDEMDRQGTPVLHTAETRTEDAHSKERYQKQLCLSITGLGRLLGPEVINSVAITGSDPYLRTGSDVAVLFEAKNPMVLKGLLTAQINLARQLNPQAQSLHDTYAGIDYIGARSPDRSVCSYLAVIGNTIVVTNSPVQLQKLGEVYTKKAPALLSLPEYVFFRQRYARGHTDETALLILSDATIRRWCSPKWRIADSRRTLAMAAMTDLQAKYVGNLLSGKTEGITLSDPYDLSDKTPLQLTRNGVSNLVYGTMEFMTPIAELDVLKVKASEATAYERWRDTYQRNWQWFFDPIAIRFTVKPQKIAADMTIMPLIAGSQYREFVDITSGSAIAPDAADPHDALAHIAMAINVKSRTVQQFGGMARSMAPGINVDPLGWLGQSVAIYADPDAFWNEMSKAGKPERFMEANYWRLPVALNVQVDSPFKLAAFLAAAHAFIEQSSPGLTAWENLTYKGQPYVKVCPSEQSKAEHKNKEKMAVYYAATPTALIVSLNEEVLQHALDRQIARRPATQPAGEAVHATTQLAPRPWLGRSLCLQADAKAVDILQNAIFREDKDSAMQRLAWANIPILNEWKRLYPDHDPVQVHRQLWQAELLCPGGGKYVWNEQVKTMESTVYGCPAAPKAGPVLPPELKRFAFGNFGLSFENQGLRAAIVLDRK